MQYDQKAWLGKWVNFEAYLQSTEPALVTAWQQAEAAAKAMPMFRGGAKAFWQMACVTTSHENFVSLGGWEILPAESEKLQIRWLAADGSLLGQAVYHLEQVLPKGLEGKENAVFVAESTDPAWPFNTLLAMEPMPPRTVRLDGGLLSHLHFQYAHSLDALVDPDTGKLRNPMWYATMCDGDGSLLEQCNIVLALHRLPVWEKLPE